MNLTHRSKIACQYIFSSLFGSKERGKGTARILTFHGIEPPEKCGVSELNYEKFTTFIRFLYENGYRTTTVRDLLEDWPHSLSHQRRLVLTFDDGYLNHWELVCPILKQYGMTATFFVPTRFISEEVSKCEFTVYGKKEEKVFLGWEQLRKMRDDGFEIGSHGHSHSLIGSLPPEQVMLEMQYSKMILEEKIGERIVSFSYPFGQQGAFTPATRDAVQQAGYHCACTQMGGAIHERSDLFELPRNDVGSMDSLRSFKLKLEGYYDLWFRLRQGRLHNGGRL